MTGGEERIGLAWVKAQIGVHGNDGADRTVKKDAEDHLGHSTISGGGIRARVQALKKTHWGSVLVYKWRAKALRHFTWAYTNSGPQAAWRVRIRQILSADCEECKVPAHLTWGCWKNDDLRHTNRLGEVKDWETAMLKPYFFEQMWFPSMGDTTRDTSQ